MPLCPEQIQDTDYLTFKRRTFLRSLYHCSQIETGSISNTWIMACRELAKVNCDIKKLLNVGLHCIVILKLDKQFLIYLLTVGEGGLAECSLSRSLSTRIIVQFCAMPSSVVTEPFRTLI